MSERDDKKWFKAGLRFECTRCGDCCTGEPGYVWVDDDEIKGLARARGQTSAEFEAHFVERVGRNRTLREKPDGACVLFERGNGCTVYADRPRQCRTWPFWESNLESPQAWERTCAICPGSGTGQLFSIEEIVEQAELIRL